MIWVLDAKPDWPSWLAPVPQGLVGSFRMAELATWKVRWVPSSSVSVSTFRESAARDLRPSPCTQRTKVELFSLRLTVTHMSILKSPSSDCTFEPERLNWCSF